MTHCAQHPVKPHPPSATHQLLTFTTSRRAGSIGANATGLRDAATAGGVSSSVNLDATTLAQSALVTSLAFVEADGSLNGVWASLQAQSQWMWTWRTLRSPFCRAGAAAVILVCDRLPTAASAGAFFFAPECARLTQSLQTSTAEDAMDSCGRAPAPSSDCGAAGAQSVLRQKSHPQLL